jgi:cholesterol oxidase
VPDPYFGGAGPERAGCTQCGGCLTGCRQNAKNSLDKNYLDLAEKRGVRIIAETEVRDIRPLAGGGYALRTVRLTDLLLKRRQVFRARGVVAAGGVLGTVPLLLRCKERGSLPAISDRLGDLVRTNSEALVGGISRRRDVDYSKGIAIASGFSPDHQTNIELVRYGAGQDFMSSLCTLLVGGGPPWPRPLRFVAEALRRPGRFLRTRNPFGWAKRTGILLVMQSASNHMRLELRRRRFWPLARKIASDWYSPEKVPKYLPVANEAAERLAAKMDGDPASSFPEVLLGLTSTAHILGGCTMGRDAAEGVVDKFGRLFGYDNFYVADGSVVSVNLRVNPSLTITAIGEWIMSHVPPKNHPDPT